MTDKKIPDLEKIKDLNLEDLKSMMNTVEGLIQKQQSSQKKEALEQIKKIVSDFDLTFEEVTKAIRLKAKRGKAPALYRNPENIRQTWSGKGEPPDWFKTHPNPESLRIKD